MFHGVRENILIPQVLAPELSNAAHQVLPSRGFEFIDHKPQLSNFRNDVLAGLASQPKALEPKYFYDEEGSRLFEQICEVPEYYPTRAEIAVLKNCAEEIKNEVGQHTLLIEFGSGSGQKIQYLLDKFSPAGYMAIEISREQLLTACDELSRRYPDLRIIAVCTDYCQPLDLPEVGSEEHARRVAFFPGSTIGNFTPEAAVDFLRNVHRTVGTGGGLLIGVDMKKDAVLLNAAYNDQQGVTAAFNLNLLRRMNRELGADFDTAGFSHHAFYNEALGRIEMHLVSRCKQHVRIDEKVFPFEQGESIHTENSYKYAVDEFQLLARRAEFEPVKVWFDKDKLFSVHYLVATQNI